MTHKEMFGDAQWLCTKEPTDGALFRSTFNAKKDEQAEIIICGLGYFKLYINGKRVGNDEFVPAYTDYHDRPDMILSYPLSDEWTYRIYCLKYDISQYLTDGENIIGVSVGSGFYNQHARKAEGNMKYGNIKLCYRISKNSGEVLSDCKTTKCTAGFFKKSQLFTGEVLDYTGFDRSWNTENAVIDSWEEPAAVAAPNSNYYIQECPSDKVAETLKPELIKDFGTYSVYGIPRNITGYPVIKCENAGEKVEMECAEEIHEDGSLDNISVGYNIQRQLQTFITDDEKIYHPEFVWFGFRYFTLTNNAKPVEVRVIHSDVEVTSDFECSDETLNWYYKAFINTQLSNMHGSIPSDCPHRERLGYTGDGQLTCDAVMTQMDAKSFYKKWIYDIYDCQDKNTGHVQHTAPFGGGGGGPAGWGGAIIKVPYVYYRHYADREMLEFMLPYMEKYVEYMESHCENGLVTNEEKQGWCLGDWCTPEQISIPEPYVNTTLYISLLKMLVFCEKELGRNSDEFEELIKKHSEAVMSAYFDNKTNSFINDLQGADSLAVNAGLGSRTTVENIVKKYSELMEFDTGIFATDILIRQLFATGNGNLATSLLANKSTVSFETMRKAGATTLWENWNAESSHSHPMFGAATAYLFSDILGIRQPDNCSGYEKIIISPCFAECLDYAKGHITTPKGKIEVSWKRIGKKIEISVCLDSGMEAELILDEKITPLTAGEYKITI